MADPTYLSQTAVNEALSDSEQEVAAAAAGDSPSGVAVKQQQVYIWSDQFEASRATAAQAHVASP